MLHVKGREAVIIIRIIQPASMEAAIRETVRGPGICPRGRRKLPFVSIFFFKMSSFSLIFTACLWLCMASYTFRAQ